MTFNEERSTLREGSFSQLMASLRNTAIQIIKRANLTPAYTLHLGARFLKKIQTYYEELKALPIPLYDESLKLRLQNLY